MHTKQCFIDSDGILVSAFDDVSVHCWSNQQDECIANCAAFYLDDHKVHCLALPRQDNIIAEQVEEPK